MEYINIILLNLMVFIQFLIYLSDIVWFLSLDISWIKNKFLGGLFDRDIFLKNPFT